MDNFTPQTDQQMGTSTQKTSLLARLRSHRLSTTFVLLGTLSAGILVGSVITHGVSGKEQQSVDSSDARPLTIPDPVTLSNGFSKIAKEVGPAVVNINDMQDFFNRFFGGQNGQGGDDGSDGSGRRLPQGPRLRLHRRFARLHHHQQPRRR
jgi:serine protease Do